MRGINSGCQIIELLFRKIFFRLYDKEGNGYITTSTLKEILKALDDKLSNRELDGIIAEIDTDGSGTVDFDGKSFLFKLNTKVYFLFEKFHLNAFIFGDLGINFKIRFIWPIDPEMLLTIFNCYIALDPSYTHRKQIINIFSKCS